MVGKKGDNMKRIASLSLLVIALAAVLAFGVPGKTNASDNSNGRLILTRDLGVTIGEGGVSVGTNNDKIDRDQQYDRDRTYDRDREYDRDNSYDGDRNYERSREYNRDRDYDQERTYDMGGSPRF